MGNDETASHLLSQTIWCPHALDPQRVVQVAHVIPPIAVVEEEGVCEDHGGMLFFQGGEVCGLAGREAAGAAYGLNGKEGVHFNAGKDLETLEAGPGVGGLLRTAGDAERDILELIGGYSLKDLQGRGEELHGFAGGAFHAYYAFAVGAKGALHGLGGDGPEGVHLRIPKAVVQIKDYCGRE